MNLTETEPALSSTAKPRHPFYRIFFFVDSSDSLTVDTAASLVTQSFQTGELYIAGAPKLLDELLGNPVLAGRFQPLPLDSAACTKDGAFEWALQLFGDQDLIFVTSHLLLPHLWDLRLAWTAQRLPTIATVSPICNLNPNTVLECDGDAGAHDLLTASLIDWSCYQHSSLDLPDIGSFLRECVFVSHPAAKAVHLRRRQAESSFVQHFLNITKELRFAHVLADHLYVGTIPAMDAPAPVVYPTPGEPSDAAHATLSALRHHARAYLSGHQAGAKDPNRLPTSARQLHITHSWGGGLERWVKEYSKADVLHENFVLKSIGTWGAFGMELHLFRNIQDPDPIRTWRISPAIRSTVASHSNYRAILSSIVDEFGIDAILVSSLIGHSLDALRQTAGTVFVCHDYYPFCPALNITFETLCVSCDESRLVACTRDNPHNRFFVNIPPPEWMGVREQFARVIAENDIALIAPVESVKTNYTRLLPSLEGHFRVIPHGTKPMGSRPVEIPPLDTVRPLRILMLGSLAPHKGLELLKKIKTEVLEFAELHLVGCGTYGDEFQATEGIYITSNYRRNELPEILHKISPDMCLLLSVIPETFSYTLQETLEMGIPPVATNIGSFANRIQDGVNGLLCEPEAHAVLNRLRSLAANRGVLNQISIRLRGQKVRNVEEMLAEYDELLQVPNPSVRTYFCDDSRLVKSGSVLHCQLYWKETDANYSEEQSIAVRYWKQSDRQTLRLPIPAPAAGFEQLRLDPSDRSGGIILHELRLHDSRERGLWMWTGSSRLLSSIHTHEAQIVDPPGSEGGALIQLCGADPFFILPCEKSVLSGLSEGGFLELDISCPLPEEFSRQLAAAYVEKSERLHSLEIRPGIRIHRPPAVQAQRALFEVPLSQPYTRMQDLEKQIEEIKSSLSWRITRPLRTALDFLRRLGMPGNPR